MQKKLLFYFAAIVVIAGCNRNTIVEDTANQNDTEQKHEFVPNEGMVMSGRIRVKLEEEIVNTKSVADFLGDIDVISIQRTFPPCGKFEERTRRKGMHLWYDVVFNPNTAVTKAADELSNMDGVKHIEYIRAPKATEAVDYPFNDTRLPEQWHYNNPGTQAGFLKGSDINLFDAWAINTGSSDVIVAILDSGVEYAHEDLADNMWRNEAELAGEPGKDDDGNGYIDDFYGYNFVYSGNGYMGIIVPGDHGTHVAGTVGAVNNNGKGGCGIAGGNGTAPGVRIMGCQMMRYEKEASSDAAAFKYAADNGAVIANCSWKSDTDYMPASTKEAIDYFIEFAGCDNDGNQTGPMKGGVVIFAAGNDNTDWCYPAMYDKVVAVAAIGANFTRAYYSNYGSWVDISAPGGNNDPRSFVWSCVTGNKYNGIMGTSQACPHVSGIAALVVSQFGGSGFTNDILKTKILSSTVNIDAYNVNYAGKMGSGLIDAYQCLFADDPNPPAPIDNIQTSSIANSIILKWRVPTDDSGKAYAYDIYYSKSSITDLDISKPLPEGVKKVSAMTGVKSAGDEMVVTISDLDFFSTYYFRIDSYDLYRNHSGLSYQVSETTTENNPPVITPKNGTSATLKAYQTIEMKFDISDPDGHNMEFVFDAGSKAVTAKREDNTIIVSIIGKGDEPGEYAAVIIVSDPYNGKTEQKINYTLLANSVPKVIAVPENIYLPNISESASLDLSKYIVDDDGEQLTYSIMSSSTVNVVETSVVANTLTLTGKWYGMTDITVIATDALNAKCSFTFKVLLRDGTQEIDLYPNPVTDYLHLRTGENHDAKVVIYSANGFKYYDEDMSVGPFVEGSKIDFKGCPAGTYTVSVSYDGKNIKKNVVKL